MERVCIIVLPWQSLVQICGGNKQTNCWAGTKTMRKENTNESQHQHMPRTMIAKISDFQNQKYNKKFNNYETTVPFHFNIETIFRLASSQFILSASKSSSWKNYSNFISSSDMILCIHEQHGTMAKYFELKQNKKGTFDTQNYQVETYDHRTEDNRPRGSSVPL
jgi:hypothetical protein